MESESNETGRKSLVFLVIALVVTNVALSFENVWPTPGVTWRGAISVELLVAVLAMALAIQWRGGLGRTALRWLAVLGVVLVVGQYANVTSQGLFGRPINLYWDVRHFSAVGAMFAVVARPWLLLLVLAAAVIVPVAIYLPLRWALACIASGMRDARVRLGLAGTAAVLLAGYAVVPPPEDYTTRLIEFAPPISATYARQVRLLVDGVTGAGARSLPPQPPLASDLSLVDGADVLLVFVESYGAAAWDPPTATAALAPARARLAEDIAGSGRDVVSAFVESPTFGGGSWLAHISFLSGVEVRDDDTNMRMMTQRRETFVTTFARHGYRTVAVMPGMSQPWPEGSYYGFADVLDHGRLDYQGPSFGWWSIPDQYTLYKMDALTMTPAPRPPVLAIFPTITTHAPFVPTPPYQADWTRLSSSAPYEMADVERAWSDEADWLNLEPSYLQSVDYAYTSFGGYLREHADRDLVMILLGDHQPPALVTGPGATWEVPVHVITGRRDILERLAQRGFQHGLAPAHPALMKMHELTQVVLDAFGN